MRVSVRYRDVETTVPATCPAAFSELHCTQGLKNSHEKIASNTLSRRYEIMVHQTVDINRFRGLLDCTRTYMIVQRHKLFFRETQMKLYYAIISQITFLYYGYTQTQKDQGFVLFGFQRSSSGETGGRRTFWYSKLCTEYPN
jgi:hypothetical protein